MKKTIKYILIFILTLILLFLLLVITAKIPREAIKGNIKESTDEFLNINYISEVVGEKEYEYRHIYADAMLLNIIYCIDSQNPIESVMEAKYYSESNDKMISYDFNKIIDNNHEGNVQYMRYWHGSMSIIRPMLIFFNINQIYIINAIILVIIGVILLIMLIKTKIKELVVSYIIGIIMCTVAVVPFCLEYYWTFLIMFIASIIAIILYKKEKSLNILFLVTGMLTCYLDFLSTEIITFLIPIIIILTIKYKENKISNFKEGFKFLVESTIFWAIGYVGMWLGKWILASTILKVNAIDYVKNDMLFRINGSANPEIKVLQNIPNLPLKAIIKNIKTIFPLEILIDRKVTNVIIVCVVVMELIFIRKKDLKKLWFSGLLLIISVIPYIRYAILASHSFTHYFFTFRSQIVSIISIILAIIYSIDEQIVKKEIKIRRKKCT